MFLNFLLDFIRVSLILPLFKSGKLKKYFPILKCRKGLLNLFFFSVLEKVFCLQKLFYASCDSPLMTTYSCCFWATRKWDLFRKKLHLKMDKSVASPKESRVTHPTWKAGITGRGTGSGITGTPAEDREEIVLPSDWKSSSSSSFPQEHCSLMRSIAAS